MRGLESGGGSRLNLVRELNNEFTLRHRVIVLEVYMSDSSKHICRERFEVTTKSLSITTSDESLDVLKPTIAAPFTISFPSAYKFGISWCSC